MSFTPLPVATEEDDENVEIKRKCYRLLDELYCHNRNQAVIDTFLDLLLDTVIANILEHPNEEKYKRLKKSSKSKQACFVARQGISHFLHPAL